MENKEWKNKRVVIIGGIVLIVAILAVVIGLMLARPKDNAIAKKDTKKTEKVIKPVMKAKDIDWAALQEKNPDIYAWIVIPGTNVNYPILQSQDDKEEDYYLEHTVDGVAGLPGSIYTQKVNAKDFSDRMTVVYGHNMKNGSMFKTLHEYANADFFRANPYIYVYTPSATYTYQIKAAYDYDDRLILQYFDNFKDDTVWSKYVESYNELYNGQINKDLKAETDDKILTLSTCEASETRRWLVQGILLNEDETGKIDANTRVTAQNTAADAVASMVTGQ